MSNYVGLHSHSSRSFLDGLQSVESMVDRVAGLGQKAVALTDHQECSGHLALQKACDAKGIQPIFGMEGYLAHDVAQAKEQKQKASNFSHITLLAKNQTGLRNLWAWSTDAYTKNFYYRALMDWEQAPQYADGLIATDGCLLSFMAKAIIADDELEQHALIGRYLNTFGQDFVMELHTWQFVEAETEEQAKLNAQMTLVNQRKVELATQYGIPLIVVNDAHYSAPEDWRNHALVWAMNTSSMDKTDAGQTASWMMDDADLFYWMGKHGISEDVTREAIDNTRRLTENIDVRIEGKLRMPRLTKSEQDDRDLFHRKLEQGFRRKVIERGLPEDLYRERMADEVKVISDLNFAGYFNVVSDYCLSPETPVLTADLRWVPVGSLREGQKIAGFDENVRKQSPDSLKRYRYWKEAEVLSARRIELPCYEVLLEDGTRTIASEDHKWLVYKGDRPRPAEWVRTKDLEAHGVDKRFGDTKSLPLRAFKLVDMWDNEDTWEEGYIGGILDGEGWLGSREFSLGFAQNEGAVLDTSLAILSKWGFQYTVNDKKDCKRVYIRGPRAETLSLLGKTRPQRLLKCVDFNKLGRVKSIQRPRIVSVTPVGVREVVALETSTQTLVAQGFAHHNCKAAKEDMGMLVGPARGSAGGSLAAYLMDITEVDPVKYDLIFERFLSPSRKDLPDVDLDFPQSRLQEVKDYLGKRYGMDHICGIGTLSESGPKGILRDLGRAMNVPIKDTNAIGKIIPDGLGSWGELEDKFGEALSEYRANYPDLFARAQEMSGMIRQSGTHASGFLVSSEPLYGNLPLRKKGDKIVTAFPHEEVEELGFVKFDLLGLRHMDTIWHTVKMVKDRHGVDLDPYAFGDKEFSDPAIWEDVAKGDCLGLFQMEATSMQATAKKFKPQSEREVAELLSVNRPGVMGAGLLDPYIRRKHGDETVRYDHPMMEGIAGETYGILIYQETMMKAAQVLAGFSGEEADWLRSVVGKKKLDQIPEVRSRFFEGCRANEAFQEQSPDPEHAMNAIWRSFEASGSYLFNKSHAVAYALIGSWEAWLKHYYLPEFLTALLRTDPGKIPVYVKYARKKGITVLPPDINTSGAGFTLTDDEEGNPTVRYGLTAVRGVKWNSFAEINRARKDGGPFQSVTDLVKRVEKRKVNRGVVHNLVLIGAFDSVQPDRAKAQEELYDLLKFPEDKREVLFDPEDRENGLRIERHLVGGPIMFDPLAPYSHLIDAGCLQTPQEMEDRLKGEGFLVGGLVSRVKKIKTKHGDEMAFIEIEWSGETFELTVFPDAWRIYEADLKKDLPVVARGVRLARGVHITHVERLDV